MPSTPNPSLPFSPHTQHPSPPALQTEAWLETLLFLLSHSDPEISYRGTVAVHLMVTAHKDVARTVINTHCKVGGRAKVGAR